MFMKQITAMIIFINNFYPKLKIAYTFECQRLFSIILLKSRDRKRLFDTTLVNFFQLFYFYVQSSLASFFLPKIKLFMPQLPKPQLQTRWRLHRVLRLFIINSDIDFLARNSSLSSMIEESRTRLGKHFASKIHKICKVNGVK